MNFRTSTAFAALGCVLLASCYPYNESRYRRPDDDRKKSVTSAEQQKIQAQREKLKQKEESLPKPEDFKREPKRETPNVTPEPEKTPPPVVEKRDYAVANKVPGKEGFVFSPYNNKIIDVTGMPSGTLVQDPTYNGAGKGYFRVP